MKKTTRKDTSIFEHDKVSQRVCLLDRVAVIQPHLYFIGKLFSQESDGFFVVPVIKCVVWMIIDTTLSGFQPYLFRLHTEHNVVKDVGHFELTVGRHSERRNGLWRFPIDKGGVSWVGLESDIKVITFL